MPHLPVAARTLLGLIFAVALLGACSADSDDKGSGTKGDGAAGTFGNANNGFGNGNGNQTGGTAGDGFVGGTGCPSADVRAARVQPTIWLIIDGSGSMTQSFGASNRWNELRSALMDPATGVVKQLESAVLWGMVMYDGPFDPSSILGGLFGGGWFGGGADGGSPVMCPRLVTVDPVLSNFNAIDAMYPTEPLGGSTPTHKALEQIVGRVATPEPTPDGTVSPIYVVLATDGQPNDQCDGALSPDARPQVITAAQSIAATGTPIYVISLAGGDAALQAHLEEVATIGNTGKPPFTPMSKDELLQTFQDIIGGNVGCEVRLSGKVIAGSECSGTVFVRDDSTMMTTTLTCNDPNGWRLKDEQTIEVTGTACDAFRTNKSAKLTANFPCDALAPD